MIINLDIFGDVLVLSMYHLDIIHVLFHEWNTLKGQSSGKNFVEHWFVLMSIASYHIEPDPRSVLNFKQLFREKMKHLNDNVKLVFNQRLIRGTRRKFRAVAACSIADIKRRREGKLAKGE